MSTTDLSLGSLQADAPARQVLAGAFWAAVAADWLPGCGVKTMKMTPCPNFRVQWLRSERTPETSIGIAALDAVLEVRESLPDRSSEPAASVS